MYCLRIERNLNRVIIIRDLEYLIAWSNVSNYYVSVLCITSTASTGHICFYFIFSSNVVIELVHFPYQSTSHISIYLGYGSLIDISRL